MVSITSANAAVQILSKAMSALNGARERAQTSKDTDLKSHIATLYDDLLAVKEAVIRLTEENTQLRMEADARRTAPELRKVGVAWFYFQGEKGPYCQPCYDCNNGRLAMLTEPEDWNGGVRRKCLSCQGYFYEKPAQQAGVRPVGRRGPHSWME
jgi:hypothetical protein